MRKSIIAIVVAVASLSSVAHADMSQAQQAVSHASRMQSAAEARVSDARANAGMGGMPGHLSGKAGMDADRSNMNNAARERADAYAQSRAADSQMQAAIAEQGNALAKANVQRTRQQVVAGGVSYVNAQIAAQNEQKAAAYNVTGESYRLAETQRQQKTMGVATSSINVSAGSLPGDTQVTDSTGKTVAASTLTPSVQVAVPHIAAIISQPEVKGGHDNGHDHSSHSYNDNNGGSNAHSSAMGGRGQAGQRSGKSAANNF